METNGRPDALDRMPRAQAAQAWNDRGNALADLKQFEQAVTSYRQALAIEPEFAEALFNLGFALQELERHEEALACYDQLLRVQPDHPKALSNRGIALLALNRNEEALASHLRALAADPANPDAHFNLGFVFHELNRHEEALASYVQALAIKPDHPAALSNRGMVLEYLGRHEHALISYDRALAIEPDSVEALSNRGSALQNLERHDEALASYAGAQAIQPAHADAHWNESLCRLMLGDFEGGWRKYEWGWKNGQRGRQREFSQPLWLGQEPLAGKTILLHAEQGLGDTLQFCRYASRVAALGARVVLEVQHPLKTVLANLEGVHQVLAKGEALPAFDYHCPLLSLPLAFATRLDTIPAQRAYIRSDSHRVNRWRGILGAKAQPLVGLVWSGRSEHQKDHNRSIPLSRMVDLPTSKVRFVSLQKEVRNEDRKVLDERGDILDFSNELEDFADTAALIELMDLVVCIDTSVAHLAGAMGKPVWVLLAKNPDWRWLLNRKDSPWYPSARLFRQQTIGDWTSTIRAVAAELEAYCVRRPRFPWARFLGG